MSPSEVVRAARFQLLVDDLGALEGLVRQEAWPEPMDLETCGRLLGLAIRFYAAAVEVKGDEERLPGLNLTATDAVVVASAALRDQDLTPFDLTMWFQRVLMESQKSNSVNSNIDRLQPVSRSDRQ